MARQPSEALIDPEEAAFINRWVASQDEWDRSQLEAEFAKWLREHAPVDVREKMIRTRTAYVVDKVDRARTTNVEDGQLSFDPDDWWLALGDGARIQAGKAKADHFDRWWHVQVREHAHHVRAYEVKTDYYMTRGPLLRATPGANLTQIEIEHFGWGAAPEDEATG